MPKNPHADFTPTLAGYSGITPFRFWCQTALPLTYDDSLSYYELLNKVVNYLNHTIEDLTNVENNTSELAEAYDKLQKYVNDYFDDIDIEAELRNVLDGMAEDGTLDALLDPLVANRLPGVVEGQISGVVAEQIDGAVAEQIDESVADQLPALVDAGIPGEVSDWLEENVDPVGSAVLVDSTLTISGAAADAKVTGDEVSNLKTQIDEIVTTQHSANYFDKSLPYTNGFVKNDGTLRTDGVYANYLTAETFTLPAGIWTIYNTYDDSSDPPSTKYGVYVKDNTTGVVTYSDTKLSEYTFTTGNESTVIISMPTSFNEGIWNSTMLIQGTTIIPYEPFEINYTINDNIMVRQSNPVRIGDIPTQINENTENINENADNIEELQEVVYGAINEYHSTNYFDKSLPYTNGFVKNDGTLRTDGAYANYITAESFTLPAGTWTIYNTYDDTLDTQATKYGVYVRDNITNIVTYSDTKLSEYTFTTVNESTVIISMPPSSNNSIWNTTMLIQGTTIIPYEPFEKSLILNDNVLINEENPIKIGDLKNQNILFGKNYVAAGDSYTAWSDATYISGEFSNQNVTYDREIRLRNAMGGANAGISGSTMALAKASDPNKSEVDTYAFSNTRYLNIPENCDILTLAFGINDYSHCDVGELGDTDNSTFYGAWDKVIKYYTANRPEMKIGIICFARITSPFYEAVLDIAKYYGIPLLDFFGGENTPVYVDGKAYNIDATIKAERKAYFCGHAHAEEVEETFRGKTYLTKITEASPGHPGYRAHIDESSVIEAFLRSL